MQKGTSTLTFLEKKLDNGDKCYLVQKGSIYGFRKEVQTMYVTMK